MENNHEIDVSQDACEQRTIKRMDREKKNNEVISNISAFFVFAFLITLIVGIILCVCNVSEYSLPLSFAVLLIVSFIIFGASHTRAEKLSKMTTSDYVNEKLSQLATREDEPIVCPHCGSVHLTYQKKGFSEAKALIGMSLIGLWGVFFGVPGKDKIKATCLKCGHSFMIKRK